MTLKTNFYIFQSMRNLISYPFLSTEVPFPQKKVERTHSVCINVNSSSALESMKERNHTPSMVVKFLIHKENA